MMATAKHGTFLTNLMTARDLLQTVLYRVRLSAAELRLQPECFQATTLLDLSAGDLSEVLAELSTSQVGGF